MATRDARRARPADSGAPYYLVAPAGWPTTMEVKRLFAAASLEAPVVGASSADAALARLDREPRCAAVLVHWTEQPRPAMNLLCAIKERGAPPVAAFHPQWNRDDVRRALQLGADCLLAWPFSALELTADLNALIADGTSHSRRLLLEKGGPSLLAPDAALWVETDDDWRSRLATLAERRRGGEPDSLSGGQPAGAAEPIDALLRAAAGGMTPPMAAAVLQVVQQGTGRLEQIAADAGVDPRLLGRIARTAFELAKEPSARVGMMRQLTEMAAPVDGPGDGLAVLATLKRAAQAVVQGAAPEGADEAFVEALGRTLGVARAVVVELAGEQRAEVARRLLYAEEMEEALDAARLALFTRLIQRGHRAVAAHDLAALTALLGLRSGVNGVQPSAIIDLLGRLDPPAGMGDLDLTRLAPFRAAVPEPGNELDRLLAEALDALLAASRPLGSVDLARLSALVAALRGGAAGLVGAATWRTLADLLGGRRAPSPSDRAGLQLLVRVAKALGASDAVARGRLVRALDEWVETQRRPMDAIRFAALCRTVCRRGALDPLASAEQNPASVSEMGDFGRVGGLELRSGDSEPPEAAPLRRVAVTPGVSRPDSAPLPRQVEVPRVSRSSDAPPARAVAVPQAAPAAEALRQIAVPSEPPRSATPVAAPPEPAARGPVSLAAIGAWLAAGDFEQAAAAVMALADDAPHLIEALNRVALSLYVAGRGDAAVPLWTRAVTLGPDRPHVLFHLARQHFEAGRAAQARLFVRQVLALRPHLTPARDLHAAVEAQLAEAGRDSEA